jgi:photosystem II stability/assembly factor-like uncharacterized protein
MEHGQEKAWRRFLVEALTIDSRFAALVTFFLGPVFLYDPIKDKILTTPAAWVVWVLISVAVLSSGPLVLLLSRKSPRSRRVWWLRHLATALGREGWLILAGGSLIVISVLFEPAACLQQWRHLEGPWVGKVGPIVFSPGDPEIVYAIARSRGSLYSTLLRSTDAGETWKVLGTERLAAAPISALALEPNSSDTMYMGAREQGILKSVNGGLSWSFVNRGLTSYDVWALSVASGHPAVILAGTAGVGGAGVYRSDDAAANWLPTNLMGSRTEALSTHPNGIFLAGTDYGLYRSRDRGQSWQVVSEGMSRVHILSLAVDESSETTFAGTKQLGIFRSVDGGISWSNVGLGGLDVQALAVNQADAVVVYAGTFGRGGGGLQRSMNRGVTWAEIGAALGGQQVASIAVEPRSLEVVLVGTTAGIFRTGDGGRTWSRGEVDLSYSQVSAIAIPDGSADTLFAATVGGIFRTTDGGRNWMAANDGLDFTHVRSLVIDPLNPSTLYAGVFTRGVEGAVYRSTDSGTTWESKSQGIQDDDVRALAVSSSSAGTVYAGTFGGGVYKTIDGGVTWASLPQVGNLKVLDIALVPEDRDLVYVSTDGEGVFRSRDGGRSWNAISVGLVFRSVPDIALVPGTPLTLYVAARGGGVYRSTDEGESWTSVSDGLAGVDVVALAVDSAEPKMIYAGSSAGGVYRTEDAGAKWVAVTEGFVTREVRDLVIAQTVPPRVYAATDDGIFELAVACR